MQAYHRAGTVFSIFLLLMDLRGDVRQKGHNTNLSWMEIALHLVDA